MLKVLIVSTVRYRLTGIPKIILSHIVALKDKLNCEITVTEWDDVDESVKVLFERYGIEEYNLPKRKGEFKKYLQRLKRIIKKNNFDIIHIHGNSGTMAFEAKIAKKYSKARVIVHLHNSTCSHPKLFGPDSLLTKIMKKNADCLVACSKLAGDWLYKDYYVVLPNAIDLKRFAFNEQKRKAVRAQYNIPDDTFVIGHVGVFNEQKNQEFLLKVFAEYQKINYNSRLLLVGDGANKEHIISFAKTLKIEEKVIFAGIQQDMPAYYSAFDIFVLPSIWEGFGIVNIEAQANGLYVIASDAVPSEVNLTHNVSFIELNIENWLNKLGERRDDYNRKVISENNISSIKNAGYDIADLSNKIFEIYKR